MATRPPRFTAIPNIPPQGLTDWHFQTLNAMKENIEILIGARGGAASAVIRGAITISGAPAPTMQRVTAEGAGFTINTATVPSLEDHSKLITDVQQLANDVAELRRALNVLIGQLRG